MLDLDPHRPPVTREEAAAIHSGLRDKLPMWTITDHPAEFPQGYVARMFLTLPEVLPTDITLRSTDIDDLRSQLPPGLCCLGRDPVDDPVIVETWL